MIWQRVRTPNLRHEGTRRRDTAVTVTANATECMAATPNLSQVLLLQLIFTGARVDNVCRDSNLLKTTHEFEVNFCRESVAGRKFSQKGKLRQTKAHCCTSASKARHYEEAQGCR